MRNGFLKVIGWILFFTGIFIVFWTIYFSYEILKGKKHPPEIFKIENFKAEKKVIIEEKIQTKPQRHREIGLTEFQKELEKTIEEKLKEIIPGYVIAGILNLVSFSILAGVLIFGGTQISHLGLKLIK